MPLSNKRIIAVFTVAISFFLVSLCGVKYLSIPDLLASNPSVQVTTIIRNTAYWIVLIYTEIKALQHVSKGEFKSAFLDIAYLVGFYVVAFIIHIIPTIVM